MGEEKYSYEILDLQPGSHTLPDSVFKLNHELRKSHISASVIPPVAKRPRSKLQIDAENPLTDVELNKNIREHSIYYDMDAVDRDSRDRNIALDEFTILLNVLISTYIDPFKNKCDSEIMTYICVLFDLTDVQKGKILALNDIKQGFQKNLSQVLIFYLMFIRYNKVGKNGDGDDSIYNQNVFNRAFKSIYYMQQRLVAEYHLRELVDDENLLKDDEHHNIFRYTPTDTARLKPFQNLLIYLLHEAHACGYRLYRGLIYEQIYFDKFPTHAWRPKMEVSRFVYESIDRHINGEMWINLTENSDNAKKVTNYLLNAHDKELPTLKPDRHLFAFTDGLYDAENGHFYNYATDSIDSNRVAVKYFHIPFNDEEMMKYHKPNEIGSWYNIPTPPIQHILDCQELPVDVCKVIYAFIGRCIYDMKEKDKWEVIMFMKGVAGTGKSTIGGILKYLYHISDIAILSTNIEAKFGLSAIYDKLLFVCFEVKKEWGLNQADFQCMISGEEIQIAIKNQTAFTKEWVVPGMLMGNEVAGSWVDAAGSMSRRIVVVEFNKVIKSNDVNTNLESDIRKNFASIIHKCNLAYREMTQRMGHSGIWNYLPAYFRETQKKLAEHISPLTDFIKNGILHIDLNDDNIYMPLDEFAVMFTKYCRQNSVKMGRFTPDVYANVFETNAFKVEFGDKIYKGVMKHKTKWIIHVCVKDDDSLVDTS